MDQSLSSVDPQKIAGMFFAAYVLLWFLCFSDFLWLVVASLLCLFYLRFALSLSADQRDVLPPISTLIAVLHWGVAYLSVFSNAR